MAKKTAVAKLPKVPRKSFNPDIQLPVGQLITSLGIHPSGWDALIIGDGSGTGWGKGCGWSAVLLDHYTNLRQFFNGAVSNGTSHIAELSAYVYALMWYSNGPGKDRLAAGTHRVGDARRVVIHIVTDNQIVANAGNGACRRDAGRELWAAINEIVRQGYHLQWHWRKRDQLGLNRLTDHMSRQSRLAIEEIEKITPPDGLTVYDFNPPDPLPEGAARDQTR